MMLHGPQDQRAISKFLKVLVMLVVATLYMTACGGGSDNVRATPPTQPTPPTVTIMPPDQALPPTLTPRSPPQASGTDISTIEISGLGTTRRFAVRNSGGTTLSIRAGSWYEPKDGSYQRMMVTRTTSVPPSRVVEVPIACMQRSKGVPARGLRFFSRSKAVTGSVQSCQRNCLSRAEAAIQGCIWNCESSVAPPPTSASYASFYWGRSGRGWAWGSGTGSSASAAETDADRRCESGGVSCNRALRGYTNACGALAVSECPSSSCRQPALGAAVDASRQQAETEAIGACERGTSASAGTRGTCRIATGRNGNPAVLCIGTTRP